MLKEKPSGASQNPLLGFHVHALPLTFSRHGRCMTVDASAVTRGDAVIWRSKMSGLVPAPGGGGPAVASGQPCSPRDCPPHVHRGTAPFLPCKASSNVSPAKILLRTPRWGWSGFSECLGHWRRQSAAVLWSHPARVQIPTSNLLSVCPGQSHYLS